MNYILTFENKIVDAYKANAKKSYAASKYGFNCFSILEILENENDKPNVLIRKIYFYDGKKFEQKFEDLGFFNFDSVKKSGIILYKSNNLKDCKHFLLHINKYNL